MRKLLTTTAFTLALITSAGAECLNFKDAKGQVLFDGDEIWIRQDLNDQPPWWAPNSDWYVLKFKNKKPMRFDKGAKVGGRVIFSGHSIGCEPTDIAPFGWAEQVRPQKKHFYDFHLDKLERREPN